MTEWGSSWELSSPSYGAIYGPTYSPTTSSKSRTVSLIWEWSPWPPLSSFCKDTSKKHALLRGNVGPPLVDLSRVSRITYRKKITLSCIVWNIIDNIQARVYKTETIYCIVALRRHTHLTDQGPLVAFQTNISIQR